MKYIKDFKTIRMTDIAQVGGKNASLGQMMDGLISAGVRIPDGFAITADAYWYVINHNNLLEPIKAVLAQLTDPQDIRQVQHVGAQVRDLLLGATLPDDLVQEIASAYQQLSQKYQVDNCDVAVRSSATAEDLPNASFAGQQETFLNINGVDALIDACRKSIASLFTDRAIVYRATHGFEHDKVALSVGVQKMVRSDSGSAGVAFTVDTETGFKDVVMINGSFGLGEVVVKGEVIPDEWFVHKPTLAQGYRPIIKKSRGAKEKKIVYSDGGDTPTRTIETSKQERDKLCLSDEQVLELARYCVAIDTYYTREKGHWSPMDIEWALDGIDGKLYIVQARPETVHSSKDYHTLITYHLMPGEKQPPVLVAGQSVGQKIASGIARVVNDVSQIHSIKEGDIIVTDMTDPDWVPVMKRAAGIVTNRGGRTCHAAIVSRELGIPAIVGAQGATDSIPDGQAITIDCAQGDSGMVYQGAIPFEKKEVVIANLPQSPVPLMLNIADPDGAFMHSFLPVEGVGLARLEFIFSNVIKVHPMALIKEDKITDPNVRAAIDALTVGYTDKKQFFVDTLARGIAMIGAAFYPRPVIVRFSDLKTNEYRNLIGGAPFEPEEENPMLGLRGASRYYHELYKPAFALECKAMHKVRNGMGLRNVHPMVPFVRTVEEAEKVISIMEHHGLARGTDYLQVIMMCEIPSNVLLCEQFAQHFDGFSIGSNDLTQLTLGVDRDSQLLQGLFDERDPAVKIMLGLTLEKAHAAGKKVGICGQAPSDIPEIAQFLIEHDIDSLSLNPDAVIPFLLSDES